ncbi:MAG: pyridoxamine 5'-phosphate oxidase family protein [Myxococcota bacterium]
MSEASVETAEVRSPEELREILGPASERAANKDRRVLHEMDRAWIATSPFILVATSDAEGRCDVSPKGDPAGFVHVIDDHTLAIPERPGNRRADGFHNILANPHVGLIFLIPGRTDSLRINGRARIVRDAPFFDAMQVGGHRPKLALVVEIEQLFFHCSKAFMRSELWKPEGWRPEAMPSRAQVVKAMEPTTQSLEELEAYYGSAYAEKLYREGD